MGSSIAGWAAVSIAAGVGSLLVLRHPVTLTDPGACAGLFDFVAIIAARTWRDVALGSMLGVANATVLALALAWLARAVYRITSEVGVTIAITVTASMSPVFAVALAPSPAAHVLATLAAWTAVLRAIERRSHAGSCVVAVALLATLAATVTPLTVPAAVVAAWLGWRQAASASIAPRIIRTIIAVGAVLAAAFVIQMAVPRELSCVIPHRGLATLGSATRAVGAVFVESPLAAVLAVLGLLSMARLPRRLAWSLAALAFVSFTGSLAAFAIAFWILAAIGLRDVWEAAGHTAPGKVGAAALSLTLVVLQVLHANTRTPAGRSPDGHDQLTSAMMGTLVGEIPRGAGLVEEDATTDLLLRALPARLRSADRLHFVGRDRDAVADELATGRVFVLPRSQRVLQDLGLELTPAGRGAVTGLAEVRSAHACTAGLSDAAIPLPQLDGRTQIALVAADELSRGPVVVVLPAPVPLSMLPLEWPPEAIRGFHGRTFDLTIPADERDLAQELRHYGLPPHPQPSPTRFVSRIEMWRTPGAPLVLPMSLGGSAGTGTARILGTTPGQHLHLCPSLPFDVQPLVRRRTS